jgi:hypothetical protein
MQACTGFKRNAKAKQEAKRAEKQADRDLWEAHVFQ